MSSVSSDDGEERGRFAQMFHDCGTFLWNPEDKTVLGRNSKSWGKILFFYLIYYGFLACLFAASISIVLSTLDDYHPRFQTRVQAPGITIQPKRKSTDEQTSNIVFNPAKADTWEKYKTILDDFLKPYKDQTDDSKFMDCVHGDANTNQKFSGDEKAKACRFDLADLGECSSGNYGYDEGKPCVLIKINKIIDWYPIGYTNLSVAVGTDSGAPSLAKVLQDYNQKYDPYRIYTVCYGRKVKDVDNEALLNSGNDTVSDTQYFPNNFGVGFEYYPFFGKKRQPDYLSPLVAVKFNNIKRNEDVGVRCKAYALNLPDSERMGIAYFSFNIQIKDD